MNPAYDHSLHTRFSNPGRHTELFEALPIDPAGLSAIARNLIVHYRASGQELPDGSRNDINARWLEDIVDIDQVRHPIALGDHRPATERVQGCCRDHTLFCVGALRTHGIPARSRVGFAGYFIDGFHHDHVIVEAWLDGRWQRFDPEIEEPRPALTAPLDIGDCEVSSTGFVTAAQAWRSHRHGDIDPATYGVDPAMPLFGGERFIFDEVIYEVAHRFGDELLLWDAWGGIGEPGEPVSDDDAAWIDVVADLLLAADEGDAGAEQTLLDRYRADDRLHPGSFVVQASPYGDPPIRVELDR